MHTPDKCETHCPPPGPIQEVEHTPGEYSFLPLRYRAFDHSNGYPYIEIRSGKGYYGDDRKGFELSGIANAEVGHFITNAANTFYEREAENKRLRDHLKAIKRTVDRMGGFNDTQAIEQIEITVVAALKE